VLALVKRARGEPLAVEERPDPEPAAGEALVAIHATGICGTDVHILEDVYPHAAPLIPGHEFAGSIVALGPGGGPLGPNVPDLNAEAPNANAHPLGLDVEHWRPGDRVVGELHVGACLRCAICHSGNPQVCPSKRALGTWTDGAFAELMTIPTWLLHRPPDGLSDAAATLIEPAACAWHGLFERSHLDPGERVLILGHGPIGLLSAHLAAVAGAGQVILVGRSQRGTARLECARSLGCEVLDASTQDVEDAVAELTDGRGVDVAVETAGAEESLLHCVRCCRRAGRVVVLGLRAAAVGPCAAARSDAELLLLLSRLQLAGSDRHDPLPPAARRGARHRRDRAARVAGRVRGAPVG
jgi:L-iditol 2-dehydrogenase